MALLLLQAGSKMNRILKRRALRPAIYAILLALAQWGLAGFAHSAPPAVTHLKKILVLDKAGSANSHKESRRDLNAALMQLAADKGFSLTFISQTDPYSVVSSEFSAEKLATYQAVLFSNNEGVHIHLDSTSKTNVESFVKNGGGLIPIHAAQDFVANWQWYTRSLVQSYGQYASDSNQPKADLSHDSEGTLDGTETKGIFQGLTAPKGFLDEFYSFKASPRDSAGVTILVTVDEKTYTKSINAPMGEDHPLVWTKTEGKGRVVNFSLGHGWSSNNVFTAQNSYLTQLLYGVLRYVAGDFTGCTDFAFEEYNPDATHSDAAACKQPKPIAIFDIGSGSGSDGMTSRPLISRDAGRPLVNVSFRNAGANSVVVLDVAGRVVLARKGTGASAISLTIPSQSGVYTVVAKSGGTTVRYRATVL